MLLRVIISNRNLTKEEKICEYKKAWLQVKKAFVGIDFETFIDNTSLINGVGLFKTVSKTAYFTYEI